MADCRGIEPAARGALVQALTAVLDRDPKALAELRAKLTGRRDAATRAEAFELAGRIHAELAAVDWIVCTQRAALLDHCDAELAGWSCGVLVRFSLRAGLLSDWRQMRRTRRQAQPRLASTPPAWRDFAEHNAALAARLAGQAD